MHPRLAEILTYLARVRADLTACVGAAPPEAMARHRGAGVWTGAQILQHLGKVEGATAKFLEGLFAKAIADGLSADEGASSVMHQLDHLRVPDRRAFPIVAPERVRPADDADLASSWASLVQVRKRTLRAVATVDGRDLAHLVAPHPVFGPLDGYGWVLFLGQHEERHLAQLRDTLAS